MADVVPVGYRFLPTDEELLLHYLGNKVAGRPLPSRAVADADVYGTEPWVLLGCDRDAYFFATRKRKNATGSRVDRTAGSGSWTLYGKEKVVASVVAGREVVMGRKSSLSFNDGRRKNSGWTMHEYELVSASGEFQTQVLCHVSCNGKARNQQMRRLPPKRKRGASTSPTSKKACLETTAMRTGHQEPIFSPLSSSGLSTETDHITVWADSACQVFLLPVSSPREWNPSAVSPSLPTESTSNQTCLEDTVMEAGRQKPIFSSPFSSDLSTETYHVPEEASLGTEHLDVFEPDDFMLFNVQDLLSEETLSLLQ